MSEDEPTSPLSVNGPEAQLTLQGELTIFTVDTLKDEIFSALNSPHIRLSLSALTEIDSCGLQLLLLLAQQAQQQGRDFAVTASHPQVDELLALYQLSWPPRPGEELAS